MNENFRKLREVLNRTEKEYLLARDMLTSYVQSCRHEWAPVKYSPENHTSYYSPQMHVGSQWVVSRSDEPTVTENPRWTRECNICGTIQVTTETQNVKGSDGLYSERPVFR